MEGLSTLINQNLLTIVAVLMVVLFVVLIIAAAALAEVIKLKKRYNKALGEGSDSLSLEEKFKEFYETSSEIKEKYDKISEAVRLNFIYINKYN